MNDTVKEMRVLYRTALLVDLNNLYHAVQDKFGQRKLMILDYARALQDAGHTLTYKIAYSRQEPKRVRSFLTMLEANGFECHFGDTKWEVAMALRAADVVPNVDCVVLGSNDYEMGRILKWSKEKGRLAKCFAVNIPTFFNQFAECVEIEEGVLSAAPATA
jgi:uncharacterized LabA/DUF88 family protein